MEMIDDGKEKNKKNFQDIGICWWRTDGRSPDKGVVVKRVLKTGPNHGI